MFNPVKFLIKKILGVFAVTGTGYKIEYVEKTANEVGEIYKLSPPVGTSRFVYAVRNKSGVYDLSRAGYVTFVIGDKIVSRGLPSVKITRLPEVLSQADHDALADYFGGDAIPRSCSAPHRPYDDVSQGVTEALRA